MRLPKLGPIDTYIEVPPLFYSHSTGRCFDKCIMCEKELLHDGTQYIIEKAVRYYPEYNVSDVVFEYAMCLDCNETLKQTISIASQLKIDKYFRKRTNLVRRRKQLLKSGKLVVEDWVAHCLITGKPLHELTEYQIYAQCDGKDLLFTYMPYMISGEAMEEIAGLLSDETREILDNFIDQHFGLPPEFKEFLKDRKRVLL